MSCSSSADPEKLHSSVCQDYPNARQEELAIVGTTNREALLHGERDWLEMFRVQGLGFVLSAKGWCE